jgi:hypothetical protein
MEADTTQNQAAEEARAEDAKVMSDPSHPHYAGLQRGEESALNYIAGLYKGVSGRVLVVIDEAVGLSPKPTQPSPSERLGDRDGVSLTSSHDLEERLQCAQEPALAAVRQDLGDDFQPDIPQDPHTIAAALQQKWGEQTPQRLAGAMNLREGCIRKNPQLVAEVGMLLGDRRSLDALDLIREVLSDFRA